MQKYKSDGKVYTYDELKAETLASADDAGYGPLVTEENFDQFLAESLEVGTIEEV